MTSRARFLSVAVFLCWPVLPALAGDVSGRADFTSTYAIQVGGSQVCDPSTGVCDSEAQADNFSFSRLQSFYGSWSAYAHSDPITGDYEPGWIGALPGTQIGIAGSPTSAYAPAAFTATTFSAAAKSDIGTNGVSASIDDGFYGNDAGGVGRYTNSNVDSSWTEIVTFEGGTGTGTAQVTIEITGDLQADPGDALSFDWVQLSYTFNARALDANSSYTDFPLSTTRYVLGGAYDTDGNPNDYCNGATSQDCSGSFSETLAGDVTFHYGLPVQFLASLSASVSGNGSVAALNSARVTAIVIPEGTTFAYETQGVGNPLNITPVPEPQTYLMLLAGLGLLGLIARRRLAA